MILMTNDINDHINLKLYLIYSILSMQIDFTAQSPSPYSDNHNDDQSSMHQSSCKLSLDTVKSFPRLHLIMYLKKKKAQKLQNFSRYREVVKSTSPLRVEDLK